MEGFCGFDYGILFSIPISLLFIIGFGIWGKKKKLPIPYYFVVVVGCIYTNFAISYAFFPITIIDISSYNVKYYINTNLGFMYESKLQMMLNIMLTIPLGIGSQFILNLKNRARLFFVLFTSILIELIQLLLIVTFKPVDMFFDINDVICNCFGGLIGYSMILLFDKCMKKYEYKDSKNIINFLRNVCINCGNNKKSLESL